MFFLLAKRDRLPPLVSAMACLSHTCFLPDDHDDGIHDIEDVSERHNESTSWDVGSIPI